MNPYRQCGYQGWQEHELYQQLDQALEMAFQDPITAWGIAWQVVKDGARFPDLVESAVGLMYALAPMPPDWDLP